jgi:hypothetical protein
MERFSQQESNDKSVRRSHERPTGERKMRYSPRLNESIKCVSNEENREIKIMISGKGFGYTLLALLLSIQESQSHATEARLNQQPGLIRVALYQGPGTGGNGPPSLLRRLNRAPDSSISPMTPEQIRSGALTNYDVVIFGGGSGSKQAEALGDGGRAAVKTFVANGGGYIGICAGAYLATSGYSWSLNLVNARTVSPKWQRGKGHVKVELTENGNKILGEHKGEFDCLYANGPIIVPANKIELPPFTPLAFFRTELARNDSPAGVMVNSPAIFSGPYKEGHVVCISSHPEQTKGLEDIVPRAVTWVARKVVVSVRLDKEKTESVSDAQ